MGRFINQDPIAENGGLNLYGFVGNNGVNSWDYLGMWPSVSFFPVHQNSIDRALFFLSQGTRDNLKFAQIVADSRAFQSPAFSFVHAMTGGNASPALFRVQAAMFVNDAISMAQQAYAAGDAEAGDFYSGIALHPLQDATSPSHDGFARWYGANSVFTALSHIAREAYDPGAGSRLDQATLDGYSLTLLPAGARPDDPFNRIIKDDFDYDAAVGDLSPEAVAAARNNVNQALNLAGTQATQIRADIQSGEFDRQARVNVLLDLGLASAGSDEWLDAHLNPSHFRVNALLGQMLYQQMMAVAGDPSWADARRSWADAAKSDYQIAAAMQESVEQNIAIQSDKLK